RDQRTERHPDRELLASVSPTVRSSASTTPTATASVTAWSNVDGADGVPLLSPSTLSVGLSAAFFLSASLTNGPRLDETSPFRVPGDGEMSENAMSNPVDA